MSFGRYQVIRHLASGGMGAVYLARDGVLQREVAVKSIRPVPGKLGQEFSARFLVEARCVASLKHPNVVPIFDLGLEGDTPYIVMEVVEGPSLGEAIAGGTLAARQARIVGIQIANALAEAHRTGIVHRDVKPANILRAGPDTWKLVDFGVAHAPDSSLTTVGDFLGTPAYAAPESLEGSGFSPASDVYGLAATLYHILGGRPPHGVGNAVQVALRATMNAAPSLGEINASVSPDLVSIIDQGLSRDPAVRPSAADLAERLAAARADTQDSRPSMRLPPVNPDGRTELQQLQTEDGAPAWRGPNPNFETSDTQAPISQMPGNRAQSTQGPSTQGPSTQVRSRPGISRWMVLAGLVTAGALVVLALQSTSTPHDAEAPAPTVAAAPDVTGVTNPAPPATEAVQDQERETTDTIEPAETEGSTIEEEPVANGETDSASDTGTKAIGEPERDFPGLQEVQRLIARRAGTQAIRSLDPMRRKHPDSAYLAFLQGTLYMDRSYWKDGFDAYRRAIANDPRYREHPVLIDDAIRGLSSKSQPWRASSFLVEAVGAPARPALERRLQATSNARTRSRMAALLKKLK